MRRIIRTAFIITALLAIIYFLGPKPAPPVLEGALPAVPAQSSSLAAFIQQKEAQHRLRPGNEARIIWAGAEGQKTPYSVVYLHGFSASEKEGDPVHRDFAALNGYNLYLSRLDEHGIDTS